MTGKKPGLLSFCHEGFHPVILPAGKNTLVHGKKWQKLNMNITMNITSFLALLDHSVSYLPHSLSYHLHIKISPRSSMLTVYQRGVWASSSKGCKTVPCIWFICFYWPISDVNVHTTAAVQALYNTYRVPHTHTRCLCFTSMKCSKAFVIWVIRGHLAEPAIGQYNSLKIGVLFTECCEGAMTLIIKYWTWTRTSIDKIRFSVKMCNVCCFFSIWDMFCSQKCEEVTVN